MAKDKKTLRGGRTMEKKRLKFIGMVGMLVFCFVLLPMGGAWAQQQQAKYHLKVGTVELADAANTKGFEAFKAYCEGASGGEIKIDLYPANQLGSLDELFEGVKTGVYQMCQGDETITGFYDPMLVLSIPYLFSNEYVVMKFFQSDFFQKLNEGFAQKTGVRILAATTYGFRCFTNNKRPIKSLDDMKGLKLRVQPVPVMMELVKALGGSPTPISWGELYSALQQGVVDGQENPPGLVYDSKFYEVQKYMTMDEHVLAFNLYYANDKWYKSLPENIKKIFFVGSRLGADTEYALRVYGNKVSIVSELEKKGMQVYIPPQSLKDTFKQQAQKPVLDYLRGKIGSETVDKALKTVSDIEQQIAKEAL
jgi:tripartite ATP-independent transporter DctP family solute receptor